MQSIYTAGTSNYSMSNLYRPAGVINFSTIYNRYNGTYIDNNGNTQFSNGEMISKPTITSSSVAIDLVSKSIASFTTITNTDYLAQHIDYNQNPPTKN